MSERLPVYCTIHLPLLAAIDLKRKFHVTFRACSESRLSRSVVMIAVHLALHYLQPLHTDVHIRHPITDRVIAPTSAQLNLSQARSKCDIRRDMCLIYGCYCRVDV